MVLRSLFVMFQGEVMRINKEILILILFACNLFSMECGHLRGNREKSVGSVERYSLRINLLNRQTRVAYNRLSYRDKNKYICVFYKAEEQKRLREEEKRSREKERVLREEERRRCEMKRRYLKRKSRERKRKRDRTPSDVVGLQNLSEPLLGSRDEKKNPRRKSRLNQLHQNHYGDIEMQNLTDEMQNLTEGLQNDGAEAKKCCCYWLLKWFFLD